MVTEYTTREIEVAVLFVCFGGCGNCFIMRVGQT